MPAFVKSGIDMSVHLSYIGPTEFAKGMARDHERYAKPVQEIKNP
jgi:hypothetical protein